MVLIPLYINDFISEIKSLMSKRTSHYCSYKREGYSMVILLFNNEVMLYLKKNH